MKATLFGIAAISAFLAATGLSFAQSVPVRSGEHQTFSRLVFPDRAGRTWDIERRDSSVEITFSNGVPDLDLGGVFELVPRRRLTAATYDAGVLRLSLGCKCPVEVMQIRSGHIVVDIFDETTDPKSAQDPFQMPSRHALGSLGHELQALPFPVIAEIQSAQLSAVEEKKRARPRSLEASVPGSVAQIRRHPMGQVPLIRSAPDVPMQLTSCSIDTLAQTVLTSEPVEALEDLEMARSALLAGDDTLDTQAVKELATVYLRLGWGAEALMASSTIEPGAEDIAAVAAAMDGLPTSRDQRPDPGCGPGAAIIALLTGAQPEEWARADETAVVVLLDRLPNSRWLAVQDELSKSLTRLNRESLLVGLGPRSPSDLDGSSLTSRAAGTDIDAIIASIKILEDANAAGRPTDYLLIENARALRPSMPNGSLRDRLDEVLVETLVIANLPAPAVQMIKEGQAEAQTVLNLIMRHLPAENGAGFVVQLEPVLGADDPTRIRIRDFLLGFGLNDAARRFAPLPRPGAPNIVPRPVAATEPWLARDFSGLSELPESQWTARNNMAAEIVERNNLILPNTDLAAAESVLSQSRRIGTAIRKLMEEPVTSN